MKFQDHVIEWLLAEDNPPVRYLTLTELLHTPASDPEVRTSISRLMNYPATREILAHGKEFWEDDENAYRKYTGKYWQVIFLGQFLADGQDPRISTGIHSLLDNRAWVIKSGGQCLTANLLRAFRRLGYGDHPVVIEETEKLANRIAADGGIACSAMLYSLLPRCFMALPKLLLCFGEIPEEHRSGKVKKAISIITKLILEKEVFVYVPGTRKEWQQVLATQPKRAELASGHTVKEWISEQKKQFLASTGFGTLDPKKGWFKFGFPLHYNSDILEALYSLAKQKTPMTPQIEKSLEIIRGKMNKDGVWCMENSLNGKMWIDVEEKGKPSKWITYFALYVLKHFQ
jgi:hypothetical protein